MVASSPDLSWYGATEIGRAEHPSLAGAVEADVCVIGGGYTGLSAALNLAERGFKVVLLEGQRVGDGASGNNGGQLITGYNPSMKRLAGWMGRDDAQRLWDMAEEAKALVRERITRHKIACDLRSGTFHAAVKPRHMAEVKECQRELRDDYGYRHLRVIEGDEVRKVVRCPHYRGGLLDQGGGHLHPLNYALGLARAATEAGVVIHECSPVLKIESGPRPLACTAQGRVRCSWLVLAGNIGLGDLNPALEGRTMPVATALVATEPLGEHGIRELLPADVAVSDMNFVINYYRRTPDHRLLFGGGVSYSGISLPDVRQLAQRRLVRCFPQAREVAIEFCWRSKVAITVNRLPDLGRIGSNIFYAHGYSGQGVALTAIAGKVIAEAVAGSAERFDVFARLPHRAFPGGRRLRTALLVLVTTWCRLRDIFG
ncbi:Gamma-glutamylputrescine oxidoreductase [uncultured Gammaproteobacteria bacterium]